jgi:crotonobetainyl-CoA:carnitine CoA-transferase CaiB-like acyl-CoA transferase
VDGTDRTKGGRASEARQTVSAAGGPLGTVRVIDASQGAAGPIAAASLAALGADVIKVEPPWGDWSRQLPPRRGDSSAFFDACNRGKRSVCLDLRDEEGRTTLHRLLATADVLVHSFAPGGAERLGLDHPALQRRYPRLVHASVSAFGPSASWGDRLGVDGVAQAVGGAMWAGRRESGEPVKSGILADHTAGLLLTIGILGVLGRPGPRSVRTSLLGAVAYLQAPSALAEVAWGEEERWGPEAPYACPNGAYLTAEGWLFVAAYREQHWEQLVELLDEPALRSPQFSDADARLQHRDELRSALEAALARAGATDWEARCSERGIPAGEVRPLSGLSALPPIVEQGLVSTPGPWWPDAQAAGLPIWLDTQLVPAGQAPTLGADLAGLLVELDSERSERS